MVDVSGQITMLNHTNRETSLVHKNDCFLFYFWHPTLVRCVFSPGAVSPAVSPAVSRWCCRCATALDRTSALLLSTTIAMARSIRDISAVFRLLCACCMTLVVLWWCCGIPRCFEVQKGFLGVCSKRVSGCVVLEAFSSRAHFICTTVVQIGVGVLASSPGGGCCFRFLVKIRQASIPTSRYISISVYV